MTRTLTITTDNDADYELLKQLAARMQARVPLPTPKSEITNEERLRRFEKAFGSWAGDESTEELIETIESARLSKDADYPVL
jgi:hypothetical protein